MEKLLERLQAAVTLYNRAAAQAELTPATAAYAGGHGLDLALQPLGLAPGVLSRDVARDVLPALRAVHAGLAPALGQLEASHLDALGLLAQAEAAAGDKQKDLVARERELGAIASHILQVGKCFFFLFWFLKGRS